MRFPLDHVFHSKHFTLKNLSRLPDVGSDHFPVKIELSWKQPKQQQSETKDKEGDTEEADALVSQAGDGGSDVKDPR